VPVSTPQNAASVGRSGQVPSARIGFQQRIAPELHDGIAAHWPQTS
jgi:hypothetical protein